MSSDSELQRLANQHVVLKSGMGTLALAPVDFTSPNLRILDSGTADGLWLRELDESVGGSHTYVGTDIVPEFFPKHPPQRHSFHVQSITQDWPDSWASTFDYVHQRLVLVGAGQSPLSECIGRLAKLAKPGGWVELVEYDFTEELENGPAIRRLDLMMQKILDKVGVGIDFSTRMKGYLSDASLVDMQEKVFYVPYGAACLDADVAKKGVEHLVTASIGLQGYLNGMGCGISVSKQLMDC
ncbi:hypothetical protein BU26DRAFT_431537 [Trematosphaeria pertusa]|uniref:Methyltransferase domain-containing protein n=1 Tax=Trematosphaeria pertusa TaxID=390896 RepID=A0A6A6I9W1_9PLEO|nr:uncharacterized protein BU26DRAFT_431537 [Trematosphaeria pertusa]KAF2246838.1 hypothetical protein BU26DRAFT_431537 [Trematosphaeria pertusa]